MNQLGLMATLWPDFPHFPLFAHDQRLSGIRLNSAMMSIDELSEQLTIINRIKPTVPLYYDIKGRQLRVEQVHPNNRYLDITLNHPIQVQLPAQVLFKAGEDPALVERIEEGGRRLIFRGGPRFMVKEGESLHLRHPSLRVGGSQFTEFEKQKIETTRRAGFTRYFLSYVECQRDVDEFVELVGKDAQVMLKIESKRGLEYVTHEFRKKPNLTLVAARGDLYVELDQPHEISNALKTIIAYDPEACVGSRIFLSLSQTRVPTVVREAIQYAMGQDKQRFNTLQVFLDDTYRGTPECADFQDVAWLYDHGYRQMLLCDDICLYGNLLTTAVNAFEAFSQSYVTNSPSPPSVGTRKTLTSRLQEVLPIFGKTK